MSDPSPPSPPRRAALAFIFITVLLDVLAMGMILPVLPRIITGFLEGDAVRTVEVLGLFATVWAVMQFVASSVLGALSDQYGRRPLVLLSNFGLGLDYILMALAPGLTSFAIDPLQGWNLPGAPFLLAAAILLVSLALAAWSMRPGELGLPPVNTTASIASWTDC